MEQMDRQIFLKKLDYSIASSAALFDGSLRSKIIRTLRHPIRAIVRKIVVGFFRKRHAFILKARTFWGRTMYVNSYLDDHLWFCGMINSTAEVNLARWLIKHLPEKGVFLDIGAHHGLYTLLAHDLTDGAMSVHAFEPVPEHAHILEKSVRSLDNVTVVNAAVNSTSGEVTFYECGRTLSTLEKDIADLYPRVQFTKIIVPGVTVDSYCKEHNLIPSFLKIDVEGAELAVVRGAHEILDTHHPIVALEVWNQNNVEHGEAANLLIEMGYTSYRILGDGDTERIQKGEPLIPPGEAFEFDNILFIFDK